MSARHAVLYATALVSLMLSLSARAPTASRELAWVDARCERLLETTTVTVSVTGYSSTPDQTDDTPWLTATGTKTRVGVLAVSRDLLPLLPYGTRVYVVEDTMHPRLRRTLDVWFPSRGLALRWGRRTGIVDAPR